MAIKDTAMSVYFAFHPEEADLANRFGEAFDITFGKSHGDLSFWLAEPRSKAKERFGLQQEVLVIYSPHSKTDARVLTAIEDISKSPDFKYRLEKILCLLVHQGNEEATHDLMRSQIERVIVPFSVEELKNPHRGDLFVLSRIAGAIGEVDLFGISSPVTSDENFFGRDNLVQALIRRGVNQRQNSGVFGLRKTGKTSVLFAVKRRLHEKPVLAEYIDCQNPGIHSGRWWQVLEVIVEKCAETLRRERRRSAKISASYSQNNAGSRFGSDMRSILVSGELEQIIIMLDEIEYMTPGLSGALGQHWDEDFIPFWQTIRAVHQETEGRLCFMVAGVNPASVDRPHFDRGPNPIFQLPAVHYLAPFGIDNVREMVRSIGRYAGLKIDEKLYAYLQETYGGHPFLIRIACTEVWQEKGTLSPEKLTSFAVADFVSSKTAIKSRLAQPIRDILLSLVWWYPDEYELLQILAGGDSKFVSEYLQQHPGSLLQFAQYGLLQEDEERFAIADLREFLNERGDLYRREISPFTRGDLPPHLLPEIPDIGILGQLFEMRSDIEIKLRRIIILYLGLANTGTQKKLLTT